MSTLYLVIIITVCALLLIHYSRRVITWVIDYYFRKKYEHAQNVHDLVMISVMDVTRNVVVPMTRVVQKATEASCKEATRTPKKSAIDVVSVAERVKPPSCKCKACKWRLDNLN